jgi:hypothetical protein
MFAAAAGPDHPVWAMTMSTFVLYLYGSAQESVGRPERWGFW